MCRSSAGDAAVGAQPKEDMAASTPPDFGTGLRAALDARGNLDVPPLPIRFAELLHAETSDEPRAALPIAALATAA
jgi:hypothetical protein